MNKLSPSKIVIIYLVLSILWILFSDILLARIVTSPGLITVLSIVKGWIYIAVIAVFLYTLIKSYASQRDSSEMNLRDNRVMLTNILDTIPQSVFWKDINSVYLGCNKVFAQGVGLDSPEQVVGKTDFDLPWPRKDAEAYRADDREVMDNNRPKFHIIEPLEKADGTRIWIDTTKLPLLDETGRVYGILGVYEDITERRKLEEQLLQAQKMEAIGQLAGGIAHDFNNVLSAIVGYGSILQLNMRLDDPSQTFILQILEAAKRASGLTQSLLSFSRKQVINPKSIDLNECVKKVDKFLSRIIGEDVELKMSLSKEPLIIFADAIQIEQVLMNLAANARDAMPGGGSLYITTEKVLRGNLPPSFAAGEALSWAMLTVTDTGSGMDEKTSARIFEPFFTTKEAGRGTGLGLSIVYGAVKQNNGFINIYSEIGKGTTFRVYLPLIAASADSEDDITTLLTIRGGTESILIAEDDMSIRELMILELTEYGYKVTEASDGDEALKKFHDNAGGIRLIITDVVMPKKSGRALYEEARKINPDIRVLYTSGYPSDIIEKEGMLGKDIHFISKPFSPQDLLHKVREILDMKVY